MQGQTHACMELLALGFCLFRSCCLHPGKSCFLLEPLWCRRAVAPSCAQPQSASFFCRAVVWGGSHLW